MNLTDFYIQKKIQDGDIREFERLFARYYGPLCRHAGKIVNDMDMAEDLVQEFFYQFWKNRESFSPKLSLNAYLYQSIRNNALHYLEHLAVRKNYAEHVHHESQEWIPAQGQTELEMNDLGNIINATLKIMPERCSRIFRMNRFEGMKYREIAQVLSLSVKTVEAEMGKALQMFRKALKEYTREGAL
jgi:RNA polymerase sigma-70 factor (ECF subfamily)